MTTIDEIIELACGVARLAFGRSAKRRAISLQKVASGRDRFNNRLPRGGMSNPINTPVPFRVISKGCNGRMSTFAGSE